MDLAAFEQRLLKDGRPSFEALSESAGCQQILNSVAALTAGQSLAAHPQEQAAGYYSFPSQSEIDGFLTAGGRLYDEAEITALNQY